MSGEAAHWATTLRELSALQTGIRPGDPRSARPLRDAIQSLDEWELRNLAFAVSALVTVLFLSLRE